MVINAGVSGDTSAGGLARLDWSLADHPDAAILELGSNDMLRGIAAGRDGKESARHSGQAESGACPGAADRHAGAAQSGRRLCRSSSMPSIRAWPRNIDVLFYPFILDGVALNPKLNQADGMHPNPAGVKIIVARILPLCEEAGGRRRRR